MSLDKKLQSPTTGRSGSGSLCQYKGWLYLHVEGEPYDRGWHHGFLLAAEIRSALDSISALLWQDTGLPFSWYAANARAMWLDRLAGDDQGRLADGSGRAAIEELRGIVDGANANRAADAAEITIDEILGWNGYPELICQWLPAVMSGALKPAVPVPGDPGRLEKIVASGRFSTVHHFHPHHCSAFIATGAWTGDGEIVAAHTTWQRFANGDFYNVVIHLVPPTGEGMPILMQSVPGYIASSMDFGLNAAGLVVTSTSISASGFDPEGLPYFFRARRAGQRAATIENWVELFRQGNNGGYANSWLLAEAPSRRIAAYELTKAHEELQPPLTSGAYCSCNIPLSVPIRVLDTGGSGYDNILESGGRRVRFDQLMAEHKGRIDASVARAILADHRDLYTCNDLPSGRTICGHIDVDPGNFGGGHAPYYPWGSLDGKVTTGAMARELSLQGRWGRACGTPFQASAFFARAPQYDWMRTLTRDRPSQPYCLFRAGGEPIGL
ncbi:hypothetical protein GCM10007874_14720 [Labrys miyagiensis]|uniref:Phospholipase B n=1 Tax=Labrys miyagiensis TaxID=346912 RepID=A0ABQ6CE72_9HYPH|nr:C45 family autoproteolytic acyltransferase/hydolase [Labrys miyagiensis]GLS18455.1 hypothetical protein GCM10007874_14720 [Labrys miyagiensis]